MLRAAILTLVIASTACTSPCMSIQQLLCQCKGSTQSERNSCEDAASAQEKLAPPTAAQLAVCDQIVSECEAQIAKGCSTLDTPEGRQACGISVK